MLLWVDEVLESPPHAGYDAEVPHDLGRCPHHDFLGELRILVEMGEKGEEGVLVQDSDVVGLVLVEDVA